MRALGGWKNNQWGPSDYIPTSNILYQSGLGGYVGTTFTAASPVQNAMSYSAASLVGGTKQ